MTRTKKIKIRCDQQLELDALNTKKLRGGQLGFAILDLMLALLPNRCGYLINADSKELALLFNLKKHTGAKSSAIRANSMSAAVKGCWSIYG